MVVINKNTQSNLSKKPSTALSHSNVNAMSLINLKKPVNYECYQRGAPFSSSFIRHSAYDIITCMT